MTAATAVGTGVDKARIGELVGVVTPQEAWGIDEAMRTVLGLR